MFQRVPFENSHPEKGHWTVLYRLEHRAGHVSTAAEPGGGDSVPEGQSLPANVPARSHGCQSGRCSFEGGYHHFVELQSRFGVSSSSR